MTPQVEFAGVPPPWSKDETEAYLTEYPLPADFVWPGKDGKPLKVCPTYAIKHGYGKWLRDTPYYPGLFEAVHAVLLSFGQDLPANDSELIAELERLKAAKSAPSPF